MSGVLHVSAGVREMKWQRQRDDDGTCGNGRGRFTCFACGAEILGERIPYLDMAECTFHCSVSYRPFRIECITIRITSAKNPYRYLSVLSVTIQPIWNRHFI